MTFYKIADFEIDSLINDLNTIKSKIAVLAPGVAPRRIDLVLDTLKDIKRRKHSNQFTEHLNDKKQNPGMRGGFAEEP